MEILTRLIPQCCLILEADRSEGDTLYYALFNTAKSFQTTAIKSKCFSICVIVFFLILVILIFAFDTCSQLFGFGFNAWVFFFFFFYGPLNPLPLMADNYVKTR